MKNKPYIIPEGYFSDLEKSLSAIPHRNGTAGRVSWVRKPVFAVALAACAAIVAVSGLLLRSVPGGDPMMDLTYEQMASADMIPDFWEFQDYEGSEEESVQEQ